MRDEEDDAAAIPKSVVVDPAFDWEGDERPGCSWNEMVIYEVHVKGFTERMKQIPEHLRGTYAGLASEEAISYLSELGVTAVELLPVHHLPMRASSPTGGFPTTGATARLGFWRPTRCTARRGRAASRSQSSRKWSRRCTGPGSR